MLPADVAGDPTERTPADNQTVRNVFVIGPDKKIKLILVYPMTTGRNFDEVLRVIDSLQLTAKHKVATPVQLEAGRRRDHRRLGLRRRGEGDLPGRLGVAASPTSGSCRSRADPFPCQRSSQIFYEFASTGGHTGDRWRARGVSSSGRELAPLPSSPSGPRSGTTYSDRRAPPYAARSSGYGPRGPANELGLRLPEGFRSRLIARGGRPVSGTSYRWHEASDGMACFATDDGGWILVSNSEVLEGGASAVRFGADAQLRSAYRILDGHHPELLGRADPVGHLALVRGGDGRPRVGMRPGRQAARPRAPGHGHLQARGGRC